VERRTVGIRGLLSGVGFRPFADHGASSLQRGGFVRPHSGGVHVDIDREVPGLDGFLEEVSVRSPDLALLQGPGCPVGGSRRDPRFSSGRDGDPPGRPRRGGQEGTST